MLAWTVAATAKHIHPRPPPRALGCNDSPSLGKGPRTAGSLHHRPLCSSISSFQHQPTLPQARVRLFVPGLESQLVAQIPQLDPLQLHPAAHASGSKQQQRSLRALSFLHFRRHLGPCWIHMLFPLHEFWTPRSGVGGITAYVAARQLMQPLIRGPENSRNSPGVVNEASRVTRVGIVRPIEPACVDGGSGQQQRGDDGSSEHKCVQWGLRYWVGAAMKGCKT